MVVVVVAGGGGGWVSSCPHHTNYCKILRVCFLPALEVSPLNWVSYLL